MRTPKFKKFNIEAYKPGKSKINKIKKKNFEKLEKITRIFFNERRKINKKKIIKNFSVSKIKKYNLENL